MLYVNVPLTENEAVFLAAAQLVVVFVAAN